MYIIPCRELAEEYLQSHVKTAQPNTCIYIVKGYYKLISRNKNYNG